MKRFLGKRMLIFITVGALALGCSGCSFSDLSKDNKSTKKTVKAFEGLAENPAVSDSEETADPQENTGKETSVASSSGSVSEDKETTEAEKSSADSKKTESEKKDTSSKSSKSKADSRLKAEAASTSSESQENDEKSDHVHSWTLSSTRDANCTTAGSKTYTCNGCSETKTESIDALGHSWFYQYTVHATCSQGGWDTYGCSRCGISQDINQENYPVTGHDYSGVLPAYDYDAANYHESYCINCGDTQTYVAHTWGLYSDEYGHWYQCTICDYISDYDYHYYVYSYIDSEKHASLCYECGYVNYTEAHTGSGTCYCGYEGARG